jgi:ferric-dicitrate binding protein FerR (iron transport regulator)
MTGEPARQIARRRLKPLFDRPVSPEERAACDAVAAEIEKLQAALREALAVWDEYGTPPDSTARRPIRRPTRSSKSPSS